MLREASFSPVPYVQCGFAHFVGIHMKWRSSDRDASGAALLSVPLNFLHRDLREPFQSELLTLCQGPNIQVFFLLSF